jgi:hypothetical protein
VDGLLSLTGLKIAFHIFSSLALPVSAIGYLVLLGCSQISR